MMWCVTPFTRMIKMGLRNKGKVKNLYFKNGNSEKRRLQRVKEHKHASHPSPGEQPLRESDSITTSLATLKAPRFTRRDREYF